MMDWKRPLRPLLAPTESPALGVEPVNLPIVKREHVKAFTKGHGTYTVREQHLARDLERAYTMIEELKDVLNAYDHDDEYMYVQGWDYAVDVADQHLDKILGET